MFLNWQGSGNKLQAPPGLKKYSFLPLIRFGANLIIIMAIYL
jgi:hypothetical protein